METKKRTVEKRRKEAETEQLEQEVAKIGIEKSTKKYEKREPALKQVGVLMGASNSLPERSSRSKKQPEWSKSSVKKPKWSNLKMMGNGDVFGSSAWETEVPFDLSHV